MTLGLSLRRSLHLPGGRLDGPLPRTSGTFFRRRDGSTGCWASTAACRSVAWRCDGKNMEKMGRDGLEIHRKSTIFLWTCEEIGTMIWHLKTPYLKYSGLQLGTWNSKHVRAQINKLRGVDSKQPTQARINLPQQLPTTAVANGNPRSDIIYYVPSGLFNIAMENGPFIIYRWFTWVYLLKMVIVHGYVK